MQRPRGDCARRPAFSPHPWWKSFDRRAASSTPARLRGASPNPPIRLRSRGPTRGGCRRSAVEALPPRPP